MPKINQYQILPHETPRKWYNILPDLPEKLPPPKDPSEGPSRLEILSKILSATVLKQESSTEPWLKMPDEVWELFIQAGRPRPLMRALRLEKELKLPDKIRLYYKREDLSPTGSHKVNTALAQCYFAAKEGREGVSTETGAGQWGSALAYAASLLNLKCRVFWVKSAYDWKPDRRKLMRLYGAEVFPSPSRATDIGKDILKSDPTNKGDLGIAISEGIEDALTHNYIYSLGSVLNHVLIHQTIIGLETQLQFAVAEDYPDLMVGCLGGGSNFGGFILPFVRDVLKKKKEIKFIAAQSQASPNLQAEYRYDFADHAGKTPLLKMYTLGHDTKMPNILAEGLRYSGAAPIISLLRHKGYIDTIAYPVDEKHVFQRAKIFIQSEGYIPAPESSYGIAAAIDKALELKQKDEGAVIAVNVSGHGFLDMGAYGDKLDL
jgi:tryptophan synthase beta chain